MGVKKKKTSRASTLIANLRTRDDFRKIIESARQKLRVPKTRSQKKRLKWYEDTIRSGYGEFMIETETIMNAFHIPHNFQFEVEALILGLDPSVTARGLTSVEIDYISEDSAILKILIYSFTSEADATSATADGYTIAKRVMKKARIREKPNRARDKRIYDLSRLSISELRELAGLGKTSRATRDFLIGEILEKEHIKVSESAVKQALYRFCQAKRVTRKGG